MTHAPTLYMIPLAYTTRAFPEFDVCIVQSTINFKCQRAIGRLTITILLYLPWVVPWSVISSYPSLLSAGMDTSWGKGMGGTCDTPGFTCAHP